MAKKEKSLEQMEKDYAKKHGISQDAIRFSKTDSGNVRKEFWYNGLGWRSESFKRRYDNCLNNYSMGYCKMKGNVKRLRKHK